MDSEEKRANEAGAVPRRSEDADAAQAYPAHSCYEWNRQVYHCTPEYTSAECGTCGKITGFKWRRPWRRIVSLFTDEPLLRKEVRFVFRNWLARWKTGR
jgi:hypothetical protein